MKHAVARKQAQSELQSPLLDDETSCSCFSACKQICACAAAADGHTGPEGPLRGPCPPLGSRPLPLNPILG